MTTEQLRNSLEAYSDFLAAESVPFIGIAFHDGKVHVATSEDSDDIVLSRAIGIAMRRDNDLREFILTAVGRYMLPGINKHKYGTEQN